MVDKDEKMEEKLLSIFARDLAEGLYYLHSKSVIFGDLKPSNVLINEFGSLKLSDFCFS